MGGGTGVTWGLATGLYLQRIDHETCPIDHGQFVQQLQTKHKDVQQNETCRHEQAYQQRYQITNSFQKNISNHTILIKRTVGNYYFKSVQSVKKKSAMYCCLII